jgi:hypothetical protein
MTPAEADAEVRSLEEMILGSGGYADPAAITRVKAITRRLRSDGPSNPYIREKLANIDSRAEKLYSVRKHAAFPGGAEQVRQQILGACMGLRVEYGKFAKGA